MAIAVERCVESFSRESELVALRFQEEELLAQQDALLAQRLALAFTFNVEPDDVDRLVLELGIGSPGLADMMQLQNQLTELRRKADELQSESVQEALAAHEQEQERAARKSQKAAEALAERERWHAAVARHDAAFARRLAAVDDATWEQRGDDIEEPLDLPSPHQVVTPLTINSIAASAAASCAATMAQGGAGPKTTPPQSFADSKPAPAAEAATPTTCQPHVTTPRTATLPGSSISAASKSDPHQPSRITSQPSASRSFPSGQSVPGPAATTQCLSCCDRFPDDAVICAGADTASSSTASAGCGHYFCTECMTQYVVGAVRDRRFPLPCPMAGVGGGEGGGAGPARVGGVAGGARRCVAKLPRHTVLALLEGHPTEEQVFCNLEAASALDPARTIYCPYKACSSPMLRPDDLPPDQPTACPACTKPFCPRCLVPGWHQGYTCADFQRLPPHLRSAEDAAVLKFSAQQRWKQCPQCKQMVERSEGCNHVLCRCGCNFCYACGERYRDAKPTADNAHGTPGCACPLFDVPEDGGDGGGGGATAPVGPQIRVHAAAPLRGGRMVSRQRCRRADSIHDCPYRGKCWFWHDEDDEM